MGPLTPHENIPGVLLCAWEVTSQWEMAVTLELYEAVVSCR